MAGDRDLMAEALPRYEIGEELGRGAWGVVYSAHHETLGRDVAVKALPVAFGDDPEVKRRFRAEAKVIASLHHPHIVAIHDFVEHGSLCLLVMEKLDGGTLWSRFAGPGLSPQASCSAVLAACVALNHAHRLGILHRDVKPQNMMFGPDDTLKVTDFGIAKVLGGSQTMATAAGQVLGTPAYMSPEQVLGQELTPATDVYALGTILYTLLSGELPFQQGDSPLTLLHAHAYEDPTPLLDVAPSVPGPIAACVMQAIARDRLVRYPSTEDFGTELAEATNEVWDTGWLPANDLNVVASGRIGRSLSLPPRTQPTTSRAPEPVHPAERTAAEDPEQTIDPRQVVPVAQLLDDAPQGDPAETIYTGQVPHGRDLVAPPPPAAPPTSGAPRLGFWLTAAGGVAFLISMCLPWFQDPDDIDDDTWSGWTFPQGRIGVALIFLIAGLAVLRGRRPDDRPLQMRLATSQVGLAALVLALTVHRWIQEFEEEDAVAGGMRVATAAAVLLLVGTLVSLRRVPQTATLPRAPRRVGRWLSAVGSAAVFVAMPMAWFEDEDYPEFSDEYWSGWTFPQARIVVGLVALIVVAAVLRRRRLADRRWQARLGATQLLFAVAALGLVVQRAVQGFDEPAGPGLWLAMAGAAVLVVGTFTSLMASRQSSELVPI